MEDHILRLVDKLWSKYQSLEASQRLLIAVSGIPGSGKTTLAKTITFRLNQLVNPSSSPFTAFVPMDGFHLSRAHLSSMPDPQYAHNRRGAEFTFDGTAFLRLVRQVREPLSSSSITLYAPSFDHAIKDPVDNDIPIPPNARVIIFEGNYLSLGKEPWKEAASLMDELWFVEVAFDVAGNRLVQRHIAAGIATDQESAWRRVKENDLLNGAEIVAGRLEVDEVITSIEDDAFGS